jgi:hypothetical protein
MGGACVCGHSCKIEKVDTPALLVGHIGCGKFITPVCAKSVTLCEVVPSEAAKLPHIGPCNLNMALYLHSSIKVMTCNISKS